MGKIGQSDTEIPNTHILCMYIPFTSNGHLTVSVTGGSGTSPEPVVNPKGGGFVNLERLRFLNNLSIK